jgi:hypothetical protein
MHAPPPPPLLTPLIVFKLDKLDEAGPNEVGVAKVVGCVLVVVVVVIDAIVVGVLLLLLPTPVLVELDFESFMVL